MIEITADSVREGLTALVEECGEDFVYDVDRTGGQCVYVHEGQPDCLVGKFLHAQGVTIQQLSIGDHDGPEGSIGAQRLIQILSEREVLRAEDSAAQALARAQDVQDQRIAWGSALDEALYVLGEK